MTRKAQSGPIPPRRPAAGRVLAAALAAIALLMAGSTLGLLLAPMDDSTAGMMRALVFRCH